MSKGAKQVAEYKKKAVQQLVKLLQDYPIIGAVNMQDMPAPQLQNMRSQLRDSVVIFMTKKRLIKIAIDRAKEKVNGLDKFETLLEGMPALIFTKENPFKLYKIIQQNKSKAPAKQGQKAPFDIIVPKGPTPFAPGPVISELASVRIKTGVEGGKVAIKEDSLVAKKGEIISLQLAGILTRLDIHPMEVGLDLVGVLEAGVIYGKDVLAIDEVKFMENLSNAAAWAFNLSVEAAYPTKENIEMMLGKLFGEAKAVALESNFMADAVAEELIEKAEREMLSLKDAANIEVSARAPADTPEPEPKKKHEKQDNDDHKADRSIEDLKKDVKKEEKAIKKEVEELRKKEQRQPQAAPKPGPEPEKIEEPKIEEVVPKDETEADVERRMDAEVERLQKELKHDVKEAEEQIKEMPPEEQKEAKIIIKQVEKIVKDIAKEDIEAKKDVPSAAEIAKAAAKTHKETLDAEALFNELKKKGTLRGVDTHNTQKKEKNQGFSEPPTAEQLMAVAKKANEEKAAAELPKKKAAERVPTAHELAAKMKRKTQS